MEGLINISVANVNFKCPNCEERYSDEDDKYLNRINSNKNGCTNITCKGCKEKFGMTYDYTGRIQTWSNPKLNKLNK